MSAKILFGAALSVGLAGAALAADLPSNRAPFAPPPLPPAFTWTGFYAGGNAGGGFDDDTTYGLGVVTPRAAVNLVNGTRTPFLATNASGFVGGGQVGFNLRLGDGPLGGALGGLGSPGSILGGGGGVVLGIEADADYTDLNADKTYVGGPVPLASQYQSRTDFLGTVRGRLGYAFGNVLLYGTGGFAYGGVRDHIAIFSATGGLFGVGGVTRIQTGTAYGGGVEFALPASPVFNVLGGGAVTLKVEYIHYVLGDDVGTLTNSVNGNVFTTRVANDGNLVRAGLNYKFDLAAAPAPVVARY